MTRVETPKKQAFDILLWENSFRMERQTLPSIASFVIRFVYTELPTNDEAPGKSRHAYRGAIRHVQSDQEITFVEWHEALCFIRQFVPLELEARS